MNKMMNFFKKHCVISAILVGIGIMLIVRLIIYSFRKMIVAVIGNANATTCFLLSQKITYGLVKYSNITEYTWINAIICYLEICIIFVGMWILVAIVMAIIVAIVEQLLELSENLLLGRKHEQSLQYNTFQVWFLKVNADINILMFWIRFNICGVRISGETDLSIVKKAKVFTVESIINFGKNCLKCFFSLSIIHVMFALYVFYIYYSNWIQDIFKSFSGFLIKNAFSVSDAIDLFELISIILMLGYIFLDVRHKASGYSEIRMERFKELFQMEEKLLNVLRNINYALETNMDFIVDRKQYILQDGAKNLTGKNCYICGANISYEDKKYWDNCFHKDTYFQLQNLVEMNEEFNKLAEINKEFKNSSLSYSNIFLIDHETMLTKLVYFYFPEQENFEYKKLQLFCKSSMEKWFENRFIKPIMYEDGKKYYTEEQANQVIIDASETLDYELMNAFELEVYLKRYEKKMIKRFRRINNFSRFNLR